MPFLSNIGRHQTGAQKASVFSAVDVVISTGVNAENLEQKMNTIAELPIEKTDLGRAMQTPRGRLAK